MTNSKSIKRALILSILLIIICVSMLIGTTFAWFTDTAETSVNTIQAGTLDVVLQMYDGEKWTSAEGKTLSFKAEDGQILWQPGCTYSIPELRVVNKGNLAFNYRIIITGIQGDAELNAAINWTINGLDIETENTLEAKAISESLTISGTMKTTAGNGYQGLSIEGISIKVIATQINKKIETASEEYAWGDLNDIHTDTIIDGKGYLYVKDYQELKLEGNANITIKDLTFNNGLTIYTDVNATGTVILENCTIYLHDDTDQTVFGMDFADYGLYIGAVSKNVTWIFKNCIFAAHDNHVYTNTGNSYNVYIAGNYNAKSITFDGCEFSGSGKHGIGCSSDDKCTYYDFTVTNCSFLDWNNNSKFTNGAAIRGNVTSTALANITIRIEGNIFGINNGSTQKTVAIDGWDGAWN